MKIVDRYTFLAMPAGTVFAKYRPYIFEEIAIKGDTIGNDFWVQDLTEIDASGTDDFFRCLDHATTTSVRFDLDRVGRDGLFDEGQLFAVWEKEDVIALIERLQQALADANPIPIEPREIQ